MQSSYRRVALRRFKLTVTHEIERCSQLVYKISFYQDISPSQESQLVNQKPRCDKLNPAIS